MNATDDNSRKARQGGFRLKMAIPVVLAIGFAVVAWMLFATQPRTQYQHPEPKLPVVEAMAVQTQDRAVTTSAQGVVTPANGEVELRPQIGGDVVATHPNFKPGGYIPAGEVILKIDDTDYELALADAMANLNQARADVEIEKGQQRIAEAEFELLEGDIEFDTASRALALRQPQLQRVQAQLQAAEAAVDRAKLNLQRTELKLPYDAVALGVMATDGEYLGARDIAGTFARADEFWVELRVRHEVLSRLKTRSRDGNGSQVTVRLNETDYPGEVIRIRADVAEETRLGGIFVAIEDPLSMRPENEGRTPLLLGSYVMADLDAGDVHDIIAMPRRAMQDNNQIYVADAEDRLRMRTIHIAWELSDEILIQPTLEPGDRIITSRISGIAPGSQLRVRVDESAPQGNGDVTTLDSALGSSMAADGGAAGGSY